MKRKLMTPIGWIAAAAVISGLLLAPAVQAEKVTLTVGDKDIPAGPMSFKTPKPLDEQQYYYLAGKQADILVQVDKEGRVWWWQDKPLKAGQTYTWELTVAGTGTNPEPGGLPIRVRKASDGEQVEVKVSGKPFTSLVFKKAEPKVYLYPVIGPTGDPVTRDFPMKENPIEARDNKPPDHPHHRSLWGAHGDVRTGDMSKTGANYWNESKNTPIEQSAHQVLKKIVNQTSGPVFGQVSAEIEWINPKGEKDFTEQRTYTFFAGEGLRIIDVKSVYKFDERDVMFGDTKEGGIVAIRTAVTMDEIGITKPVKLSGKRFNSEGKSGEECWGAAANWCDYVGPVITTGSDPVTSKIVGIAVMDHPKNYGHPSHWHIRDYGLYTANPFGLKEFTKDASKDGSHTWKKGETVEFNYRIVLHKDDTKAAGVADQWTLYSDPPKFTVTEK
jgi:hypothetical protein